MNMYYAEYLILKELYAAEKVRAEPTNLLLCENCHVSMSKSRLQI